MMDMNPSERQPTSIPQSRLGTYVAALLVLGAVVFGIAKMPKGKGADTLPSASESPDVVAERQVSIDRARVPDRDDDVAHQTWQREGLA